MAEDHLFRHQGLSKDICLRGTLHKVFNVIHIRACETGCWIVEGGGLLGITRLLTGATPAAIGIALLR